MKNLLEHGTRKKHELLLVLGRIQLRKGGQKEALGALKRGFKRARRMKGIENIHFQVIFRLNTFDKQNYAKGHAAESRFSAHILKETIKKKWFANRPDTYL